MSMLWFNGLNRTVGECRHPPSRRPVLDTGPRFFSLACALKPTRIECGRRDFTLGFVRERLN